MRLILGIAQDILSQYSRALGYVTRQYQQLLTSMTTRQLVDELRSHFPKIIQGFLMARDVDTKSNLNVLRTHSNAIVHLAEEREGGV